MKNNLDKRPEDERIDNGYHLECNFNRNKEFKRLIYKLPLWDKMNSEQKEIVKICSSILLRKEIHWLKKQKLDIKPHEVHDSIEKSFKWLERKKLW